MVITCLLKRLCFHHRFSVSFCLSFFEVFSCFSKNGNIETYFVNSKGDKVLFNGSVPSTSFSEGLVPFTDFNSKKEGYLDRNGKVVIAATFDVAQRFSEGLAVVGKKNEFGELKYAFIDKTGHLTIPLEYTNAPAPFSDGLAGVLPVNTEELQYAFINKKGEVVIKIDKTPTGVKFIKEAERSFHFTEFNNGLFCWKAGNTNSCNRYHRENANGRRILCHLWYSIRKRLMAIAILRNSHFGNDTIKSSFQFKGLRNSRFKN